MKFSLIAVCGMSNRICSELLKNFLHRVPAHNSKGSSIGVKITVPLLHSIGLSDAAVVPFTRHITKVSKVAAVNLDLLSVVVHWRLFSKF